MISVDDPREITVMGFIETDRDSYMQGLSIDVKERLSHSLDDVIEPGIARKFGILIADDDFSAEGAIAYTPAAIDGKETDLRTVEGDLAAIAGMIARASQERDRIHKEREKK